MKAAQKLAKLPRLVPLMIPRRRRLAYIGADDMSNLGDRAMLDVHKEFFTEWELLQYPSGTRNRLLKAYQQLYRQPPVEAVFLGGGTLVGRDAYLRRLRAFYDLFHELPMFSLGVGVEDPEFGHGRTSWDQLTEWATILRQFHFVGVRGPRSRQILNQLEVNATVIGDSALALAQANPTPPSPGLIGLNAGWVNSLWGDDLSKVLLTLTAYGKGLADSGYRLRVFTTWAGDIDICRELANEIGSGAEFVVPESPHSVITAVRECEVVVGLKLHAVVLAAAAYVPTVMLDYRPKCADFHDSIGMSEYTIRTDQVTDGWLSERVDKLLTTQSQVSRHLDQRVKSLASKLQSAAQQTIEDIRVDAPRP